LRKYAAVKKIAGVDVWKKRQSWPNVEQIRPMLSNVKEIKTRCSKKNI